MGPELRFDSVIISYVKSLSFPSGPTPSPTATSTGFDVDLSSVQLDLAQSLGGQVSNKETGLYAANQALSFVSLRVDGFKSRVETCSHYKSPETLALHSSFDSLALRLGKLTKSTALNGSSHFDPCFILKHTMFSLAHRDLSLSFGQCTLAFDHMIPDLLASTALGVLQYALPIIEDLKQSSEAVQRELEQYLFTVIHLSRDRPIVDSLSAFQPSYLLQGRPQKIRTDVGFKLLVYLRLSLHHLQPPHRQHLTRPTSYTASNFTSSEIRAIVDSQLQQAGLEYEPSVFPLQPMFPSIFTTDQPSSPLPVEPTTPLDLVRVEFEGINLLLNHGSNTVQSEFLGSYIGFIGSMRRGQWMQPTASPVKTASTWSARGNGNHDMTHVAIVASFGTATFMLCPQILEFIQIVIRVTRGFSKTLPSKQVVPIVVHSDDQSSEHSKPIHKMLLSVDFVLTSKLFQLKAAAESLIIDYKAIDVIYSSNTIMDRSETSQDISTNQTLVFRELKLQAFSTTDPLKMQESIPLAAFTLDRGNLNAIYKAEPSTTASVKGVARLEGIRFDVPRSAMRLYRFAEQWQAEYLPRFDSMMRSLLAEIGSKRSTSPRPRPPKPDSPLSISIHAEIASFRVSLQVMRGTWLSWEVRRIVLYFTSPHVSRSKKQAFGLQIGSQNFRIASRQKRDAAEDIRVKFDLPTFSLTGRHDGEHIHCLALVEYFHFTVKPAHWDTLLTVQQKFGKDFNDFLLLVEETRSRKEVKPSTPAPKSSSLQYDVSVKVEGFRVGLEGLTSTLFLECENIMGSMSDTDLGTKRQLNLFDLTLSLASQSVSLNTNRNRRSAFVSIDSQVSMHGKDEDNNLNITVPKIHAVMQPSSIGEIGDFVDHLQVSVDRRRYRH